MHCSRVDAFRHRAGRIMADRRAAGHACARVNPNRPRSTQASERMPRDEGHPPRIVPDIEMRAGGGKSAAASLAIISASL